MSERNREDQRNGSTDSASGQSFSEKPFSEKIEKMTQSLLDDWEVSEDDFLDTQDLQEAAEQIAAREAEERARRESGAAPKIRQDYGSRRERDEEWETPRRREADRSGEGRVRPSGSDSRRRAADSQGKEAGRRDRGTDGRGRKSERHAAGTDHTGSQTGRRDRESAGRGMENERVRRDSGRPEREASARSRDMDGRRKGADAYCRDTADRRRTADSRGRDGGRRRGMDGRRKQSNPVLEFWNSLQPMDKVIGFTGLAVCLFAIITFSTVISARGVERQVETFAQIGQNMAQIAVADEGTFLAVADGHMARQQASDQAAQEESEYDEKEDDSNISVGLNMTSVEKDLKIKFVNRKTGKLIPYVNFQVEIKGPDQTMEKVDEDKDGIIYLTGLTGGEYTVRITGPEGLEGYDLPTDAQTVTVKKQIEYKKVDVSDEIKTESEVNASKEDTEIKAPVESVLQDTVEWVESTRTPVNGNEDSGYIEVKKSDVPDPAAVASLDFSLFAGMKKPVDTEASGRTESGAGESGGETERTLQEGGDKAPRTETPSTETPSQPEGGGSPETGESRPPETEDGNVGVTGVSISPQSAELEVGGTVSLTAAVQPDNASNKNVEWKSDNENVAKVDGGTVTGVGEGKATITVTADGGKTASAAITVKPKPQESKPVESVTVTGGSTVAVGSTITLSAQITPTDASHDGITWESADSGVASVDGNGKVTGVKAGTTTITAKAGGKSGSCQIQVKAAETALQSLSIGGPSSGKKGETVQLSVTVKPEGADASVTWTSSNGNAARVDGKGLVTCVETGETVITATSTKDGNIKATLNFKVVSNESSGLTVKDTTIEAGKTARADYSAGNVADIKFSIKNTKYATIDGSGNISAIRAGETEYTVKVKYKDGKEETKSAKLIVKAAEVKKITLDQTKVTLKVGESLKLNPTIETTGYTGCLWYTSDKTIVSVEEHGGGTIKALKPGKVTITAKASEDTSKTASCEVTVSGKDLSSDTATPLKDKNGKQLYVKKDGKYVPAVAADYYKYDVFYRLNEDVEYRYTGWQNIDGKRYFFDKNGNKVTGDQVIQGVKYSFGSDGALSTGSGVLGIDVSKHNGSIDWNAVKNSGVSFVIIRCGYRGSSTGALIADPKFAANIQGATAAGLKVGLYVFSQAVNNREAVEEASMAIEKARGYKITYPIFIDVEAAGGRADGIDNGTRTEVIRTFCNTVQAEGYTAGLYANRNWLNTKISTGSLGNVKVWLAQYAAAPTYNGRYEMWQYSSTGKIGGIKGNVDLNISYLGY